MKTAPSELQGRAHPVIEHVTPRVDGGRYPAKREVGDLVVVEADVFADGHDELVCDVLWRAESDSRWRVVPMEPLVDDRWRAAFPAEHRGRYLFCVRATLDSFGTWLRDVRLKASAGHDLTVELLVGAELLAQAAVRAERRDGSRLEALATQLRSASEAGGAEAGASEAGGPETSVSDAAGADVFQAAGLHDLRTVLDAVGSPKVAALVRRHSDPGPGVTSGAVAVVAERLKARFSTWYELFPRSASPEPGRHGTLADTKARLTYVSRLGFDVLYLPPIHPIGQTNRKGRDGARVAGPDDPGSPWAIGGSEGGHTAVHPQLGTLEDLVSLVDEAARLGIEVALDLAYQCSPDHPWVKEHPEWFRWLPDGTARYAENPPKRYEDIYPINFDTPDWQALWAELLEVVLFWVRRGIRIFRVDNPHTKPFRFWEWLIAEVQSEHPDVLFLGEAFTRPKVMKRLAKAGFTQSYTYFAWRNTKWELEEYLTELHSTEVADYLRPNFWPNTPDILTETLQHGGPGVFMARLVLAATSVASYGIYGPVFELCEHEPCTEGSEDYLHSEKYEIRNFDLDVPGTLAGFVTRVNEIRRQSQVLQHDRNLALCPVDNDQLIAYARTRAPRLSDSEADTRPIVVVVNLDPRHRQSGWVEIDLDALGIDPVTPYEACDLLTGTCYSWQGPRNFVVLDPGVVPAHILRLGPVDSELAL
ncbi:MAG: alpha-1,4-glucan--maltose-1-phosphate maltosyltransferase [Acidimicrobiales bacterium]